MKRITKKILRKFGFDFCEVCGRILFPFVKHEALGFADDIDEEGRPTGYYAKVCQRHNQEWAESIL